MHNYVFTQLLEIQKNEYLTILILFKIKQSELLIVYFCSKGITVSAIFVTFNLRCSMDDFILYFKMGLNHVLDFSAYDHILFLIVLAVVFVYNQWKKVLWLVTLFTIGHSITLALSAFGVLKIKTDLIEFLIPLTIFITGVLNLIIVNRPSKGKENINLLFALFFGLIHGLGFSNYFKMMVGQEEDKLFPLFAFALGIEAAQIIIVLGILTIGTFILLIKKITRKHWVSICSSIVILISIKMMFERVFW